ncbi:chromosome partitioning protein [Subtercola boreus]|uniref:non-specific protein-tyrosine kinase n=1 Tax=Subtercola boreus TaxID=120213 RepID=A0A3E0VEH4_9MICO|nr:polysaccharide biosynthesis tyrosine autokinase [Subtercola boreus]RFA08326.1 chromosome partitioning protein [Subtercola boreus]TQL54770.1 capsular exopolysaccharide synthesis family protein [Subtercola boreus]
MELRDYLRVVRKGWVIIVAITLAGVAAASLISIAEVPKYLASSKVFVSAESAGSVSELSQGSSFTQNQVKSYTDVVTTPAVLQPVIDQLGLDISAADLAKQVTASTAVGTVVVDISVTDESAQHAAEIANAISSTFETVVAKLVPVNASGASPVKISVLQQALVPTEPSSPNTRLNLVIGAALGLIAGLIVATLRQLLDTKIRNEQDVEAVTSAPILGGIAFDPRTSERPLVVHDDPRSPRSESFRTLRTNLQFLVAAEAPKSYVLTSSIPGEGKSTSSANLAIVTAAAGTKVVIIDADLRKPRLSTYLGIEGGAGLTDVLVGRATLADVLQKWGTDELWVLPAGRIPPNPSELLGSLAMIKLIATLEAEYDLVIFDAPPLLPVTDAAILAKHTGGALLIVGSGRVHRGQLKGSIAALQNVGSGIAGIVMTMLPTKGPDSYGYGRYGYGYGYGYGDDLQTEGKQKRKRSTRGGQTTEALPSDSVDADQKLPV